LPINKIRFLNPRIQLAALYDPKDIHSVFWSTFGVMIFKDDKAKNLLDSAKIYSLVVDNLRENYGNPLPSNDESVTTLDNISKAFVGKCDELNTKKSELNSCQSTK
jgi:hypothetical protein